MSSSENKLKLGCYKICNKKGHYLCVEASKVVWKPYDDKKFENYYWNYDYDDLLFFSNILFQK